MTYESKSGVVTQADREAVAAWLCICLGRASIEAADVRDGASDNLPLVQAFTRHREDSTRELVEALKEVRLICGDEVIEGYIDEALSRTGPA